MTFSVIDQAQIFHFKKQHFNKKESAKHQFLMWLCCSVVLLLKIQQQNNKTTESHKRQFCENYLKQQNNKTPKTVAEN